MKIIGLTGSIGMGKSVTAAMLSQMGLPVFDSDHVARSLLAPDGAALETTALAFPEAWDRKRRVLDRRVLGDIVFADPEKRQILEEIIHPLVRQAQKKFIKNAQASGAKAAVLDIPLLFETQAELLCDLVLCVDAPHFLQKQRVLSRPAMDERRFYAILAQQMPQAEKLRLADRIIQTGLGVGHTRRQLQKILKELDIISS